MVTVLYINKEILINQDKSYMEMASRREVISFFMHSTADLNHTENTIVSRLGNRLVFDFWEERGRGKKS